MKLLHRFAYYFGGFSIGVVFLIFFFSGKKTSCDYGIQARTLKNIRVKDRAFSDETLQFFQNNGLDTSAVSNLLQYGKVVFKESNTKMDSCNQYVVRGIVSEKTLKVRIANCDDLATVLNAYYEE